MTPEKRRARVIVTADPEADLEALAELLSEAEVDDLLGTVQGFADVEQLESLRATQGVHGIEIDMIHEIAPPDSAVQ